MLRLRHPRAVAWAVSSALLFSSCGGGEASARTSVSDASHVRALVEAVFARVAANDVSLPRASRLYANVSLAMLVVLAPVDEGSAQLLDLVSGAPGVKAPAGFDAGIAAVAAGASVARRLLPGNLNRAAFARVRDTAIAHMSRGMDTGVLSRSVSFGVSVAAAVTARAADDGSADAPLSVQTAATPPPGAWVPPSPGLVSAAEPGWGGVRRFLRVSRNCHVRRPSAGTDPASPFAEEAAQVRDAAENLTAQQRLVATFWDDTAGTTGTPAGHWANIALSAAARKGRGLAATVDTLAATAMVSADAVAAAWRAKFSGLVERPVTVIQRTDPGWQPYLPVPAVPDHPSAHAAVSRAAAEVLTRYMGESAFHDPGYGVPAGMRAKAGIKKQVFESFVAAARQAGQSRVWGGVEYRMSVRAGDVLGACIGTAVSEALGD